jgi:surface antigen
MTSRILAAALALSAVAIAPASADPIADLGGVGGGGSAVLPPYLQCVPYARQVTGIRIFGDAHTWWGQAEGHYARGTRPRVGAVMSFRPHGNMRLGHVAAVSRIVDSRTVLLRHANWSLINGRRGQIEDNVRAIDVSPGNDWSEVRVWFAPIGALGGTHWPLNGFIYSQSAGRSPAINPAAQSRSSDLIGDIIADRLGR